MMWRHFCQLEKTVIYIGEGEECNWCGEEEPEDQPEEPQTELKEEAWSS